MLTTIPSPPTTTSIHLGPTARVFLPSLVGALLFAWVLGGVAQIFAALMLSVLASAFLIGHFNSRGILVRVRRVEYRTVGESFLLQLELQRTGAHGASRDLLLSRNSMGSRAPRPTGLVDVLEGSEPLRVPLAHKLTQRGRTRQLHLRIDSSFPFGLVCFSAHYDLEVDLLALPRLGSLGDLALLTTHMSEHDQSHRRSRCEQEEFHSLAEWREGMSLRNVHWKLSARRGRQLVRRLEGRSEPAVRLVLITALGYGARPRSFETAVSLTATLCEHFLRQGRRVQLHYAGASLTTAPAGVGRGGWAACLESLAEVQGTSGCPTVDLAALLDLDEREGEDTIVVFAGGQRPAELLNSPKSALQLDVDAPAIDGIFHGGRAFGLSSPLCLSDAS